jgi:phosphoglycolate phosphatase
MSTYTQSAEIFKFFEQSRCIVFDWDGTLLDSVADIIVAVHHTAQQLGLPKLSDNIIRQGIGLGSSEQILRLYGQAVDVTAFKTVFEQNYIGHTANDDIPKTFEGVEILIHQCLQYGYDLAIATGKSRSGLDHHLNRLGWSNLFMCTCCADEFASKPAPDMLQYIATHSGHDLHTLIVVGDSYLDLEMAQQAGAQGVGVLTGVNTRDQLERYPHLLILEAVNKLGPYLRKVGE